MYMRKLSEDECPLYLRLCAGPSEKVLSLVLKENETGEVNVSFHLALRLRSHDNPASMYFDMKYMIYITAVNLKLHSSTVGRI